ncbi:MAG: sulfite exporter TauE/SafE family protein [Thermoanaerobaculia bacterium]|nr:sulfite exporter TauE/SafE family protein [Thermoanaerobaculia bacterium]
MSDILFFALAGFIAQMIDGVLGMGYGVTATSLLLSLGVPAAVSSASVHTAEVFSTGFSAFAHLRLKNVLWPLVKKLMVPGIIGAVIGAYILTSIPGDRIKPFIAAYLLVMGVIILVKAFRRTVSKKEPPIRTLGLVGGFFDAIGGGGWGPIVVGSLLAGTDKPRTLIGSVNFAEFFVTLAAAVTFLLTLGVNPWRPILGLALGGAIAAPIAARIISRVPAQPLRISVGIFVILLSVRTIWIAL